MGMKPNREVAENTLAENENNTELAFKALGGKDIMRMARPLNAQHFARCGSMPKDRELDSHPVMLRRRAAMNFLLATRDESTGNSNSGVVRAI
jgi:hypothetical protein